MKEFIICSAILIRDGKIHKEQPIGVDLGFVVTGRRHGDCYKTIANVCGVNDFNDTPFALMTTAADMGFITNTNKFLNRKQAMIVAYKANQLLMPQLHDHKTEDDPMFILTSEDLFLDKL